MPYDADGNYCAALYEPGSPEALAAIREMDAEQAAVEARARLRARQAADAEDEKLAAAIARALDVQVVPLLERLVAAVEK